MISKDELDKTILELEMRDTTFANCAKLADLYIVRNNLEKPPQLNENVIDVGENSDFLRSIKGKNILKVFNVLDDVFDTLKCVNPKFYNSIMEKIKDL